MMHPLQNFQNFQSIIVETTVISFMSLSHCELTYNSHGKYIVISWQLLQPFARLDSGSYWEFRVGEFHRHDGGFHGIVQLLRLTSELRRRRCGWLFLMRMREVVKHPGYYYLISFADRIPSGPAVLSATDEALLVSRGVDATMKTPFSEVDWCLSTDILGMWLIQVRILTNVWSEVLNESGNRGGGLHRCKLTARTVNFDETRRVVSLSSKSELQTPEEILEGFEHFIAFNEELAIAFSDSGMQCSTAPFVLNWSVEFTTFEILPYCLNAVGVHCCRWSIFVNWCSNNQARGLLSKMQAFCNVGYRAVHRVAVAKLSQRYLSDVYGSISTSDKMWKYQAQKKKKKKKWSFD